MDHHDTALRRRIERLVEQLDAMQAQHPADVATEDLEAGARNLLAAVALAEELREAS